MPSMTSDVFDLGARNLTRRPSAAHLEAAKRYLVDGESPSKLAREYSTTRQWIYRIGRKIRQSAAECDGLPPGFEKVELVVPSQYVRFLRAIERECMRESQGDSEQ